MLLLYTLPRPIYVRLVCAQILASNILGWFDIVTVLQIPHCILLYISFSLKFGEGRGGAYAPRPAPLTPPPHRPYYSIYTQKTRLILILYLCALHSQSHTLS